MLLGPILGPVIGGLIVDLVSWRWIFYVNVPIGIVAVIWPISMLPARADRPGLQTRPSRPSSAVARARLFVYGLSQAGQAPATSRLRADLIGLVLIAGSHGTPCTPSSPQLIDVFAFPRPQFPPASVTTFFFGAALFGGCSSCRSTTRWSGASPRSPRDC